MKTPAALNELLQKPMDRKEFLRHTAAIVIFAAGGGVIAQSILKGLKFGESMQESSSAGGYGASSYGGATLASSNK